MEKLVSGVTRRITRVMVFGWIIAIVLSLIFISFKPTPPPNFCKKISSVNITTDAYLLSVEGDYYIVIVGDKSTSIIKK